MSDYAKGGYVKASDGTDTVPVNISPGEKYFTADQVRGVTEETRGGEEPFDWQVAVEALQKALNSRPEEVRE